MIGRMRVPAALSILLAAACGGSSPPPAKPLVVDTPRGAACDRAGAAGARPLELKLAAAPGVAEVTVDGAPQLSVRAGGGAACAYLDLPPGAHPVTLRATGDGGLGLDFAASAGNPKGPWWYDVFRFGCGGSGVCSREELVAWRDRMQADRKALTDPCSATQIRDVKWDSERVPGGSQVTGVSLSFTLFVYAVPFDKEPRDPDCPEN
jgi:hypothetical protein